MQDRQEEYAENKWVVTLGKSHTIGSNKRLLNPSQPAISESLQPWCVSGTHEREMPLVLGKVDSPLSHATASLDVRHIRIRFASVAESQPAPSIRHW